MKNHVQKLKVYYNSLNDNISPRAAKKELEREKIVDNPIEQDNNIPIDIEKVKASTDMSIHSDNNNLYNGIFHFYCNVSDKALCVLYQIQGDKFKVIWLLSRKPADSEICLFDECKV
ncbi:hypothetical protein ACTFIW_008729 [Dictyostelium discoideum]